MTLPSNGAISLAGTVGVELGFSSTGQISLGSTDVRSLYGIASGAIRLAADGYGKSVASVTFRYYGPSATISATSTDVGISKNGYSYIASVWGKHSSATTGPYMIKFTKTGSFSFAKALTWPTGLYFTNWGPLSNSTNYTTVYGRSVITTASQVDSQGGMMWAMGVTNTYASNATSATAYQTMLFGRFNSSGTSMFLSAFPFLVANVSYNASGGVYNDGTDSPTVNYRPFGSFIDSNDNFFIAHTDTIGVDYISKNHRVLLSKVDINGNYINTYSIGLTTANSYSSYSADVAGNGYQWNPSFHHHMHWDDTTGKMLVCRPEAASSTTRRPIVGLVSIGTSDNTFSTSSTTWSTVISTSANAVPDACYYDGGANCYSAGYLYGSPQAIYVTSINATTGARNWFATITSPYGTAYKPELFGMCANSTHVTLAGFVIPNVGTAATWKGFVLDINLSTQAIVKELVGPGSTTALNSYITAWRYDRINDKHHILGKSTGYVNGSNTINGFYLSTDTASRDTNLGTVGYTVNTSPTWSISYSTPTFTSQTPTNNAQLITVTSRTDAFSTVTQGTTGLVKY